MNILVVDDEPLIHLSIEKLILASSEDCQISHAYNGAQMLEALEEKHFHLAYVDIKMPGISGLEAIRQAREISPSTRYYIMTGFNDFEYAKQAVKLKVEDYLMKPLDQKTIWETIQTAIVLEFSALREKKTIFRNWLESALNHRKGHLGTYGGYYRFLLLITMDRSAFPPQSLLELLRPYEDSFVSSFRENELLLLCFSENSQLLHHMFKELALQRCTDGITVFSSSITRKTEELAADLQKLLQYSCLRVVKGNEHFYYLKPLLSCEASILEFCTLCVKWQCVWFEKNYSAFCNSSEDLCRLLEQNRQLDDYHAQIHAFLSRTLACSLPSCSDPPQLRGSLLRCAHRLVSTPAQDRPAQVIIQYIQKHYRENLSIGSLTERFGFSANYISSLLKQELGISYSKYLTQLRLNHAKELLLSTRQSVKEITEACGYYSQSHFTKLFLEYEGCTPAEFRKTFGQPTG